MAVRAHFTSEADELTVASSFGSPQDHLETLVGKTNEFAATKWLMDSMPMLKGTKHLVIL